MPRTLRLALCLLLAGAASRAMAADSAESFYHGRQIILQTGSAPGDGYDVYGRLVARFIARFIPGNPTLINQYVPSGGSLVLANQFGNTTPRDGSVFGLFNSGVVTTPLLNPSAAQFDPRKFSYIGSASREGHVFLAMADGAATSLDDLLTKNVIVGATAPGGAPFEFPQVTNALLGTKMKVVTGYKGSAEIMLAVERGELQGYPGIAWGSAKQGYATQIAARKMLVVAQYGMAKHPELPDVPLFPLGKTESDRQIFQLLYARQAFGRPFAFPPGVPVERIEALRKAFADMTKDAEFLAEAKKVRADITLVPGAELEEITEQLYQVPKDIVARAQRLLATNEGAK